MNVFFKTIAEFKDEGFVDDYSLFYRGNRKNPDNVVKTHLVLALGGKRVNVVEILDTDAGVVRIECDGLLFKANLWMLKGADLYLVKKPKTLLIKSRNAKFFGETFSFPCGFDELNKKDAVKLAKWVLKCAKVGK